VKAEPSGLGKAALAIVQSAIKGGETWVSFKSIWEALRTNQSNFSKCGRSKG
jgi:hypothetical protein